MNLLANHGYLPRSGRDISVPVVAAAVKEGYNWSPDVFDTIIHDIFFYNVSSTETPTETFNLHDLGSAAGHNNIEVDGSLSRNDHDVTGDANSFDASVWGPVAEDLGLHDEEGARFVTIEVAARARANRQVAAQAANEHFNGSELQVGGSFGTSALYLTTLWDEEAQGARKDWVRIFFGEFSL